MAVCKFFFFFLCFHTYYCMDCLLFFFFFCYTETTEWIHVDELRPGLTGVEPTARVQIKGVSFVQHLPPRNCYEWMLRQDVKFERRERPISGHWPSVGPRLSLVLEIRPQSRWLLLLLMLNCSTSMRLCMSYSSYTAGVVKSKEFM